MKKTYWFIKDRLFNDRLDFRAHIFNTLGLLGFALGFGLGWYYIFNHSNLGNILGNFAAAFVAVIIITAANYTQAFKPFFLFTVILVFFIIFPVLFFAGGGYHSSMPCFFVFAVVFTILMLEGWLRTVFTILEFALYLGCFLTAYFRPATVLLFPTEAQLARDIIIGCMAASVVLAIAIHRHLVVYDLKLKELEQVNQVLQSSNRVKNEFLQDIKHEIRNPLTVISLGADFLHNGIDLELSAMETHNALNAVQNEAMRLGRMVNGMVELAIMSDGPKNREKTDFAAILYSCVETYRLQIEQKQNQLHVEITPDLPYVYAEPEQLKRVPINLLSNAIRCTEGGEIRLEATADISYITVCLRDTGSGIEPSLLPRVFERGVSGQGGKGYGLSMCKTIVEAHGGIIEIKSQYGAGTDVTFTIPVYGGQSEVSGYE